MSTTVIPINHPFALEYPATSARPHPIRNGDHYRFDFPNGYSASVVRFSGDIGFRGGSYGADDGLWELAVMRDGHCNYDTPITDDDLGHLTEIEVAPLVEQVRALPAPGQEATT